jgi:hypothetical protein
MRVEKAKFDEVSKKLLGQNPTPRKAIKTGGKRSPKPILAKP